MYICLSPFVFNLKMAPTKNVKISQAQQETMLDYMTQHRELSANRLLGPLGKQKSKEMWESLAAQLNAMGTGATKDVTKWKTTWSDWKLKVKSKASGIAAYTRGTGGGEAPVTKLTLLEEKLLAFLGPYLVSGDTTIEEVLIYSDQEDPVICDVIIEEESVQDTTPPSKDPDLEEDSLNRKSRSTS